MVDGVYLADSEGHNIFGDLLQESYKTLYYDISDVAGKSSFSIVFEAVCKYPYQFGDDTNGNYNYSTTPSDYGDFIAIDNVKIYQPTIDYQLESISYGEGHTSSEPITITVQNLSGINNGFDIPVYYQINNNSPVFEIITDTIAPSAEINYTFSKKTNLSVEGKYTIVAGVSVENNTITINNEQSISFSIDTLSIRMGIGLDTVVTCNARFTDDGGVFKNYSNNILDTLTFKPEVESKVMTIDFEEFNLEENSDYLLVYSGPDVSSPRIAALTGTALPQSYTSTALGGELTFLLYSDGAAEKLGWMAYIHCIDKDSVDLSLNEITKPSPLRGIKTDQEEVAFTVINFGIKNIEHFKAYYQIDSLEPVMQEFNTTLQATGMEEFTFSSLTNFSNPENYQLTVWVEITGDSTLNNNLQSVIVNSLSKVPDAGISSIETIVPARENYSTIAVTLMNYGNVALKNIDIAYRVNDSIEVIQTMSDTIEAGESKLFEFSVKANLTDRDSSYQVEAYTIVPEDTISANDTLLSEWIMASDNDSKVVANFTGGSNIVFAGDSGNIDLINDYTLECWVNLSDPASYGHIFNKTNISMWYQGSYGTDYYGENSFILNIITESGEYRCYIPNSYRSGVWQHLALTVSASNEYLLYIDGVAQQWELLMGTAGATQSNKEYPICIGNRPTDMNRSAIGQIDELRVWNKCLDAASIRENSMTDYAPNTPELIAYYKFKEGSGKFIYDYSANDNTAVVYNAAVTDIGSRFFWDTPGSFCTNYSISGQKSPAIFDKETQTYTVAIDSTDFSALTASFDVSQSAVVTVEDSLQQSGVTINDFTHDSLKYSVEGVGFNEGIQQTFFVKVEVAYSPKSGCELKTFSFELNDNPSLLTTIDLTKSGERFEQKVDRSLNLTALKSTFTTSPGARVIINDIEQSSPQILAADYSKPLLLTIVSESNMYFKNYIISIDTKNDQAELISFSIIEEQVGQSQIDTLNSTVQIWTKNNSNLSALASQFEVSKDASLYVKSVKQQNEITVNNFISPVTYSVVSEDETNTIDWNVQVTVDDVSPIITLIGDSSIEVVKGEAFTDPGATANDNIDGDISINISTTGSVDTDILGSFPIMYSVNDEAGNSDTITRTVHVATSTKSEVDFLSVIEIYANEKTIYIKTPKLVEDASVTLFDVTGNQIMKYGPLHYGLNTLATELLPGIYLVEVKKENQSYTAKIVINYSGRACFI
ncbi:MAG: DUF5011 domain-containing protein, partial [Bacteroidales bacterium]|nr:DUF5011 domain-containing protein [Bacteroidales bacterium]